MVPEAFRSETGAARVPAMGPELKPAERREFQALIYRLTGITLSDRKHELIAARLSPRLRHLGLGSYGEYLRRVSDGGDTEELREMIDRITTNKTSFFRENHHFEFLLQQLRRDPYRPRSPRIWSAACSSGEEPYSLAMTLAEAGVAETGASILASDISTRVLRQAQSGIYDLSRIEGLPTDRLRRHFLRGTGDRAGQFQIRPTLRRRVEFRRINLIDPEWPVDARFDFICCRNVLIYFDRQVQDRLLRRFASHLVEGGYLVLGHSENLAWLSDLFEPVGQTVYRLQGAGGGGPVRRVAQKTATPIKRIHVGEIAVSASPLIIGTVLGSCVAACLYDPVARVGGMNHFLLPDGEGSGVLARRYGVHAMELLINEIMRQGGDRRRLEAKVFGAASSPALGLSVHRVAETNAAFIRRFLATEGIPLISERLGGTQAMDVRMEADTGRVRVRLLGQQAIAEAPHPTTAGSTVPAGDVTLF